MEHPLRSGGGADASVPGRQSVTACPPACARARRDREGQVHDRRAHDRAPSAPAASRTSRRGPMRRRAPSRATRSFATSRTRCASTWSSTPTTTGSTAPSSTTRWPSRRAGPEPRHDRGPERRRGDPRRADDGDDRRRLAADDRPRADSTPTSRSDADVGPSSIGSIERVGGLAADRATWHASAAGGRGMPRVGRRRRVRTAWTGCRSARGADDRAASSDPGRVPDRPGHRRHRPAGDHRPPVARLRRLSLTLMPVAIAINIAVGSIAVSLRLPIYLDSIGTVLVGVLAGPWAGALTGLLSNLIWSILPIPGGAGPIARSSPGRRRHRPDGRLLGAPRRVPARPMTMRGRRLPRAGAAGIGAAAIVPAGGPEHDRAQDLDVRGSGSQTRFVLIAIGSSRWCRAVAWITNRTVFRPEARPADPPVPVRGDRHQRRAAVRLFRLLFARTATSPASTAGPTEGAPDDFLRRRRT